MVKRIMRAFKMHEISAVDRPAQAHAKMTLMKRNDDRVLVFGCVDESEIAAAKPLLKFAHPGAIVATESSVAASERAALRKDMYGVSRFAELIQSINYLAQSSARERDDEGDGSPVPDALKNWLRDGTTIFRAMADEEVRELIAVVAKRNFSAGERKKDAKSGAAMSDGSFPIEDAGDLANAMRLAGHAKDPAKARAHIKSRAKALGLESKLSAAYKREDGMLSKALSLFKSFGKATDGLSQSVKSIVDDASIADKGALIDETIKQFSEHVEGELEKSLSGGDPVVTSEDDGMSIALKKALGLAETASEAEVLASLAKKDADHALALDIVKAAMSDDERAYHDKIADETTRKGFRAMSKNDRVSAMSKRDDLPPAIAKALAENEDLKKQVAALVAKDELETFKKRAEELGVPVAKAEVLMKAAKGDRGAMDEVFAMLKAATSALDGSAMFKEFGSSQGEQGDEVDAINAKAAELRKANPALTEEQAFAKAYSDPANRKLATAERAKNRPAAA